MVPRKSISHLRTQCYKQTCYMTLPSAASFSLQCFASTPQVHLQLLRHLNLPLKVQPGPFQPSALHSEQLDNRELQKGQVFFSGPRPRHFSLTPLSAALWTPRDPNLHFACLRIKKKKALISATAAAKLSPQQRLCKGARTSGKGSVFHSSN